MNKKFTLLLSIIISSILVFSGCSKAKEKSDLLQVTTTTTMLKDLVDVIAKDKVETINLMGPGIDPHLYKASAGDVRKLQEADIIVYNGIHLEGKMSDLFDSLYKIDKNVISIEDAIDTSELLMTEDNVWDPHIWFSVRLWKKAAVHVSNELSKYDPENKDFYSENLNSYLKELDDLDLYVKNSIKEIPDNQKYLITAHDAFAYYGHDYGVEVVGIQGISTQSEAATSDIKRLSNLIVDKKIKAIFIETSVPTKTIESLRDSVRSKGFDVSIGGELFSDSLGDKESGADTYIKMVKKNTDTLKNSLK